MPFTPGPRDDWWNDDRYFCVPDTTSLVTGKAVDGYCLSRDEFGEMVASGSTAAARDRACALDPRSAQCVFPEQFEGSSCDVDCAVARAEAGSVLDPTPASSVVLAAYYCTKGDVGNCGLSLLGAIPVVGKLKTLKPAIGFAEGLAESALTLNRLQHGSKNLTKAGILPGWSGTRSPEIVREALAPILEHPTATFDHTLGGTRVRGFLGDLGGKQVVVFVFKEGPFQGQLASSSVPSPNQLKMWGLQ
jgi:hypothetical protein